MKELSPIGLVVQPSAPRTYLYAALVGRGARELPLSTVTPILAGMVAGGKLGVVGGVYELETGRVTLV